MAHKSAGGSTSLGRDSRPKYLGVKLFGGEKVRSGQIIIRQRGNKYKAGVGVRKGGDDTLYAINPGTIKFRKKMIRRFTGNLARKTIVEVVAR